MQSTTKTPVLATHLNLQIFDLHMTATNSTILILRAGRLFVIKKERKTQFMKRHDRIVKHWQIAWV